MNSWLARRFGKAISKPALRKLRHQVVGVERRILGNTLHALAAEQPRVDVGAQQHAGVADVRRQAADGLRAICSPRASGNPRRPRADHRQRQERQQVRRDADRPGAGSAAAVRRRERLVQVHVDDVEAHVARLDLAQDRVEVGAVVIQQPARLVHDVANVEDRCSNTPSVDGLVSISPAVCGPTAARKRVDVDIAVAIGGNFTYRAAAHDRGGGIGAVRRIRHQDFRARASSPRAT